MTITRGELKGQILRILQKDSGYSGFYTDAKINDAIQDSQDFVSTEMMLAGDGWLRKIVTLNSSPGVAIVELPPSIAIIDVVRYKVGNRYLPLVYDDADLAAQFTDESGMSQYPSRYRIVDNKLYFNPPPGEGGTDYVQIEYAAFAEKLLADNQIINRQFNNAMLNFIKWRSASVAVSSVGKGDKEWVRYENEWFQKMVDMVGKRNRSQIFIREFSGG